jgi:hypothetical protein
MRKGGTAAGAAAARRRKAVTLEVSYNDVSGRPRKKVVPVLAGRNKQLPSGTTALTYLTNHPQLAISRSPIWNILTHSASSMASRERIYSQYDAGSYHRIDTCRMFDKIRA